MMLINKLIAYGLLFLTLTACNSDDAQKNMMYKPVSAKSYVPIHMYYTSNLKSAGQVGHDYEFRIKLTSGVAADSFVVSYSVKGDLILNNPDDSVDFNKQTKGQVNTLVVNVNPQQNGLFYIYLSATLYVDGRGHTRSFAIPVNVGEVNSKKQLKSPGVVIQDADSNQKIISMPAIETTE